MSPHGLLPHAQPEWSCDNFAGYILPYVLLWNPLQQFHLLCVHDMCISPLVLECWKLGQANSLQPRLLHTSEHTITIIDDDVLEGPHDFSFQIIGTTPSGTTFAGQLTTVNIEDNESKY